jgi:hypothetical protein
VRALMDWFSFFLVVFWGLRLIQSRPCSGQRQQRAGGCLTQSIVGVPLLRLMHTYAPLHEHSIRARVVVLFCVGCLSPPLTAAFGGKLDRLRHVGSNIHSSGVHPQCLLAPVTPSFSTLDLV